MPHYMQKVLNGGPALDFDDALFTLASASAPASAPAIEDLIRPQRDSGENAHRATQALLGNAPPKVLSLDAHFDAITEALTAHSISQNHDLVLQIEALRAVVHERVNTQASAQQQAAGENYQQLYSEARTALNALRAAKADEVTLRSRVDHLSGILSQKRAALRAAEAAKPAAGSYPTAEELAAWRRTVDAARQEHDAAAADLNVEREALRAAKELLEESQERFAAIQQKEQISLARLENRPIERLGVTIDLSKEEK